MSLISVMVKHTRYMQCIAAAQSGFHPPADDGRSSQRIRQFTIDAPGRVQVAMQVNLILAAGPLIKVIKILVHHG